MPRRRCLGDVLAASSLLCYNTSSGRRRPDSPRQAGVAQLVEQLIRNQQVLGSSPSAGSKPSLPLDNVRVSYRWQAAHLQRFSGIAAKVHCISNQSPDTAFRSPPPVLTLISKDDTGTSPRR